MTTACQMAPCHSLVPVVELVREGGVRFTPPLVVTTAQMDMVGQIVANQFGPIAAMSDGYVVADYLPPENQ